MLNHTLSKQFESYGRWKDAISQCLEQYRQWLENNGFSSAELDLRLFDLQDLINKDSISIAFVAEFSRGKSELINAIFFSNYKRRLLPSDAGRTTMCPTEIFFDRESKQSYIRLLPIETRLEETTITEYKNSPNLWSEFPLDTSSAEKMTESFKEVIRVKKVPFAEADKLGLIHEMPGTGKAAGDMVEIPVWRHALISFNHPLLTNGLVVLDTPGLNALGNEPELTINMLPNAQSILFVLGADTGVTKSDMDLWKNHIMSSRTGQQKGLLVVLNKIDTLWDELKTTETINKTISEQCQNTARQLNLNPKSVIPISAQKGLLAKIKGDAQLLQKSNLTRLEHVLMHDIIPQKQAIIHDNIIGEIRSMMHNQMEILQTRLDNHSNQLKELRELSSENAEALIHMMEKTKAERLEFKLRVENFQARRKILSVQLNNLQEALNIEQLDKLINKTRSDMSGSWTTMGLKSGMKTFFEGIMVITEEANNQAQQSFRILSAMYKQFAEEYKVNVKEPAFFPMDKYTTSLKKLHAEGEAYRTSSKTAMMEQSFVIKKFFISLVSRSRDIFQTAQKDAEFWSKSVLNPLADILKEQKNLLDDKIEKLRQISKSRETVEVKIKELEQSNLNLEQQLLQVSHYEEVLSQPVDENTQEPAAAVN